VPLNLTGAVEVANLVKAGISEWQVQQFAAVHTAARTALAVPTPMPGATPASTPVTESVAQSVLNTVAATVNKTVVESQNSVIVLADALEKLWAQYRRALASNNGDASLACADVLKAANVSIESTFDERASFDPYFGRVVDMQHSSVFTCNDSAAESEFCFSQALDSVFRANLRANPSLRWQVFVSQTTGAVRIFPGVSRADALDIEPSLRNHCDARRSPTYAASAFGPRRLVFMLDLFGDALCLPGDRARPRQGGDARAARLDVGGGLGRDRHAAPARDDGLLRAGLRARDVRQCARAQAVGDRHRAGVRARTDERDVHGGG
jgi:hypothetical protein